MRADLIHLNRAPTDVYDLNDDETFFSCAVSVKKILMKSYALSFSRLYTKCEYKRGIFPFYATLFEGVVSHSKEERRKVFLFVKSPSFTQMSFTFSLHFHLHTYISFSYFQLTRFCGVTRFHCVRINKVPLKFICSIFWSY